MSEPKLEEHLQHGVLEI